jgi:hypothetical protein
MGTKIRKMPPNIMNSLKDRDGKSRAKKYWSALTWNVSCFLWQWIYLHNPFDREAARQAKLAFQKQLKMARKKGALPKGRAKRQRTAAPVEEEEDDADGTAPDNNPAAATDDDDSDAGGSEHDGDEEPEEGGQLATTRQRRKMGGGTSSSQVDLQSMTIKEMNSMTLRKGSTITSKMQKRPNAQIKASSTPPQKKDWCCKAPLLYYLFYL